LGVVLVLAHATERVLDILAGNRRAAIGSEVAVVPAGVLIEPDNAGVPTIDREIRRGTGVRRVACGVGGGVAIEVGRPVVVADAPLLAKRAQVEQSESNYAKLHAAEFPSVGGQLQSQIEHQGNVTGSLAQYGVTPVSQFSLNTAQVTSNYNWNGGLPQLMAQQAKRQM